MNSGGGYSLMGTTLRIVIGDDHALVRDSLRPCLRQIAPDCAVLDAASYAEVLDFLGLGDIALVVLDPGMGDMAPVAGVEAVRRSFAGPLALLSSVTDPGLMAALLAAGGNGFIPKRFGLASVVSALRLVLAGETFLPPSMAQAAAVSDRRPLGLTVREHEVLALLRQGLSNKGIARQLAVAEVTVKSHLASVFRKLRVQNRVQAARAWISG